MNRKVLYGYQIEDGKLVPQPQEAAVVSRIFALCLEGKFQWEISDILNAEGIQYSPDCPAWTKFKISLTLRNQRYAGADGYPVLIGSETFQSVQTFLQKKWGKHVHRERPVSVLRETLRCPCGGRLTNAIKRGLERPEHPEDVVTLILRGISARYACFEANISPSLWRTR